MFRVEWLPPEPVGRIWDLPNRIARNHPHRLLETTFPIADSPIAAVFHDALLVYSEEANQDRKATRILRLHEILLSQMKPIESIVPTRAPRRWIFVSRLAMRLADEAVSSCLVVY